MTSPDVGSTATPQEQLDRLKQEMEKQERRFAADRRQAAYGRLYASTAVALLLALFLAPAFEEIRRDGEVVLAFGSLWNMADTDHPFGGVAAMAIVLTFALAGLLIYASSRRRIRVTPLAIVLLAAWLLATVVFAEPDSALGGQAVVMLTTLTTAIAATHQVHIVRSADGAAATRREPDRPPREQ